MSRFFSLRIPHSTSHIQYPTSYIPHSTSYILHPTSHIPHSTSYIPHSTSYIPHSTSYIPHSTSHIPHSTSNIPHFTSYIPHSTFNLRKTHSSCSSSFFTLSPSMKYTGSLMTSPCLSTHSQTWYCSMWLHCMGDHQPSGEQMGGMTPWLKWSSKMNCRWRWQNNLLS